MIYLYISLILLSTCYVFLKVYFFIRQSKKQYVLLELTPSYDEEKSPHATRFLFNYLHANAYPLSSFTAFFFPQTVMYSLEIVATREKGIRYILRIPLEDQDIVMKQLYAYSSKMQIKEVEDYMFASGWMGTEEIGLSNHFAFSINTHIDLTEYDPIAYLTSQMTQLDSQETIALHLIMTPVGMPTHKKLVTQISALLTSILAEEDITKLLKRSSFLLIPFRVIKKVMCVVVDLVLLPFSITCFIVTLGQTRLFPCSYAHPEQCNLTSTQRLLYQDIYTKLQQPLYEATIRITVSQQTKQRVMQRLKGLSNAWLTFRTTTQSFVVKKKPLFFSWFLKNRVITPFRKDIYSLTELATMIHVPYMSTTKTPYVIKTLATEFPPSLQLIQNQEKHDLQFAINTYANSKIPLGLTAQERQRHMYILGATGTGKTTLLQRMILEDMENGKGFCVIDPHGDLSQALLRNIPCNRKKDVIIFDPSDIEYPIGLNILELSKEIDGSLEKEKDIIASYVVSIFSKLSSAKYWGPRMENVLRIAVLTVLETEKPTLFTIYRLLIDNAYRKSIVDTLTDPVLILFWKKEFASLGSYQKAAITQPITNKLGRFLTSPHAKYIVAQEQSTINFSDIMDQGKILVCNLSKGTLGEDTSQLFGALFVAKVQLAALKRARILEHLRKDFYLYIDEFQNFATPSFAEIMSEARKYHLCAILAHQTISQIEDQSLLKVILANTGTILSFRTSSPYDQDAIAPFFAPQVTLHDLANLPTGHFYMKINALVPQDVCSGETIIQYDNEGTLDYMEIQQYSRTHYGVKKDIIEAKINQEFDSIKKNEQQRKNRIYQK